MSESKQKITQKKLKDLLKYNPKSGEFIWIIDKSYQAKAGMVAGTYGGDGYRQIRINGVSYQVHRLAWLYMTGEWPDNIDHINHIKDDNVFSNLRNVSRVGNGRNLPLKKNNKSGFTGVSWVSKTKKWRSSIVVKGKNIHLGFFDDKQKAIAKREVANILYGFHENHGVAK